MKVAFSLFAAGLLTAILAVQPAHSASLLGGLVNTGSDSGNGSGLVSNNSNGSIGVGGSGGASVNLGGLGGGGSLGGALGGDSGSSGVPGVAEVSGNGSGVNASLLGGGGSTFGLLGSNATLPGFGGLGLGGDPGAPGAPGAPGSNGFGSNGGNGFNGYNGSNGGAGVSIPGNISSRLRAILQMLAARDWIALANGRAICLNNFGTTEISNVLPQKDWSSLNRALPSYAQDIATLRQLLANCRSSSQRASLSIRDLNRVIGIDVNRNGTPVLYML